MPRALLVAAAILLLTTKGAVPALEDHPLSIYTKDGYRLEQVKPAPRRQARHTIHRRQYSPRAGHERRLSRWEHHKPVKPVGPPPDGYRATTGAGLLAQARSTIGLSPRELGVPSSLWCADAVNVWLRRSGLPTVKSRWARAFTDYGTRASGPAPGVIAVFPRGRAPSGHVGVVAAVRGNNVEVISGNCGPRVCVSSYPANRAIAYRWPGRGPVAEPPRDLAKVIPLPPVKVARIPVPRPRPVLASDFAELEVIPDNPTLNLALLDLRAAPAALILDVVDVLPEPVALPPQNIFEAFADKFLQPVPVGNCKGWDKIKPGVKRIVSDATRHFSRKYGRTLIAEANSCYRDPQHNRRVGGARFSAHLNFTGLDFQVTAPDHSWAVPAQELWTFCKSHPLARGCGVYRYKHIIHADVNPVRHRGLVTWDWRARRPTRLAMANKKKKKFASKKTNKKKFVAKKWKKKKYKSYASR